ncbi:MAG: phosphatidate cytidylyltransferase [Pseudomonadota bacterium]|nr:phosphatidate cytidylyltransferase [Pseudomonadota bacterium]
MLKQRLLTALILIPVTVGTILLESSIGFAFIMGVLVVLAAWEWAGLCGWQHPLSRSLYSIAVMFSLVGLYGLLWYIPQSILYLLILASLWWLWALYGLWQYQHGLNILPKASAIKACLGLLLLLPAWSALVSLHHHHNQKWIIFLLILIWVADSGAYFIGRRFGHLKLADKISPGKTWEGLLGALVMSILVVGIYAWVEAMSFVKFLVLMMLCLLTVIASIIGDLLESVFKRQMGLKDSSQLLPGHGGILDRIDSLTSAVPIFVMGLVAFGRVF